MILEPEETALTGTWIVEKPGSVKGDEVEERIEFLIRHHLVKIATDQTGWEVLYQDPTDGRYWELTRPQGGWHGGGPMKLSNLADDLVSHKYNVE